MSRQFNLVHTLSKGLNRLNPNFRIIDEWPGFERIIQRLTAPIHVPILVGMATRHRARLASTKFVGISGSAGKTMTKALVASVLSKSYDVRAHRGTSNYRHDIAKYILSARPDDDFCAIEVSAGDGPGCLKIPLKMLQPDIGLITNVGTDHISAYDDQDAIAAEKGRLIRALPADGLAILNADDARVAAMADTCSATVITFGLEKTAAVRADSIESVWPGCLSFDLLYNGSRVRVQTRLYGKQWVTAALAAAAAGLGSGIELHDIAAALGEVDPFVGRMSVETLDDGVTFLRDDWKSSVATIEPALDYLASATGVRKFAVLGTISDYSGDARPQYLRAAKKALSAADFVVFVGHNATMALRAQPIDAPWRLKAFGTTKAANDYLSSILESKDVVLLKCSNVSEHLVRILLARKSRVTCWRMDCRKSVFCNSCESVDANFLEKSVEETEIWTTNIVDRFALRDGEKILLGLGNYGAKYQSTPHNVGADALDVLAAKFEADWCDLGRVSVARICSQGIPICLLKIHSPINHSGPILQQFAEAVYADSSSISMIFDDVNLPIGKSKIKMRGSDGGHLGVRSILETFQTVDVPRIKIGVGGADDLVRKFEGAQKRIINETVMRSFERLNEVVEFRNPEGTG